MPGFACEDTGEGREKTGVGEMLVWPEQGTSSSFSPARGVPPRLHPQGQALLLYRGLGSVPGKTIK